MTNKYLKTEGGFVTALVAISIVPILLSTIFIFDIGKLLLEKQRLKILVDIGARDGLQYIAELQIAIRNGKYPSCTADLGRPQDCLEDEDRRSLATETLEKITERITTSIGNNIGAPGKIGTLELNQIKNNLLITFPALDDGITEFTCGVDKNIKVKIDLTYTSNFIFDKLINIIDTKIKEGVLKETNTSSLPFCL